MENAARALTIAGTVLITVIVISALLYAYQDITKVRRQESENQKTAEVEQFNKAYESYEKDIYGIQLISLAHKMRDYNKSINPQNEYIYNFASGDRGKDGYTYMELNVGGKSKIKDFVDLQKDIDTIRDKYKSFENLEALYKAIEDKENYKTDKNGKDYAKADWTYKEIEKEIPNVNDSQVKEDYRKYNEEYKPMKTKKYKWKNTEYSDNGRIYKMEFED